MRVLPLTSSPIHTEVLEPERVAQNVALARRGVDFVIADLHPSYSPLNRAVFDKADRILIPLTPDLPAIRAVVKLRDVADELGMRDRLALIINRANSGVSGRATSRRPSGSRPSRRSAPRASCSSRRRTRAGPWWSIAPREPITQDVSALADRLLGRSPPSASRRPPASAHLRPLPPPGRPRPRLAAEPLAASER